TRTHAEGFRTANPQGAFLYTNGGAELGHWHLLVAMGRQDVLEAGHNPSATLSRLANALQLPARQAVDEGMQQILLQRSRDLLVSDHIWFRLGEMASVPMQALQLRHQAGAREQKKLGRPGCRQLHACQLPAIWCELLLRQCH